ncbi:MAG: hypothetical protein KA419_08585 [Acidobacteria bacterium]|nr:hypothetical protein [Acidobacteriota bacterium]
MSPAPSRSLSFAHLVNPVRVGPASDLYAAQPVTFESMRRARDRAAAEGLSVTLLSAQYPEDRERVPSGFTPTPDLAFSSADIGAFRVPRKLPLFADLLARLYGGSPADILVYTNVDIALQPDFYLTVAGWLSGGADSAVVNRRTVAADPDQARDLEWLAAQPGERHRGYDCFVFRRGLLADVDFGRLLIGVAGFGKTVVAALSSLDPGFRLEKDAHLTFHINNDRPWRDEALDDYWRFNLAEGHRVLDRLRERLGGLSPLAEELYRRQPSRFRQGL